MRAGRRERASCVRAGGRGRRACGPAGEGVVRAGRRGRASRVKAGAKRCVQSASRMCSRPARICVCPLPLPPARAAARPLRRHPTARRRPRGTPAQAGMRRCGGGDCAAASVPRAAEPEGSPRAALGSPLSISFARLAKQPLSLTPPRPAPPIGDRPGQRSDSRSARPPALACGLSVRTPSVSVRPGSVGVCPSALRRCLSAPAPPMSVLRGSVDLCPSRARKPPAPRPSALSAGACLDPFAPTLNSRDAAA